MRDELRGSQRRERTTPHDMRVPGAFTTYFCVLCVSPCCQRRNQNISAAAVTRRLRSCFVPPKSFGSKYLNVFLLSRAISSASRTSRHPGQGGLAVHACFHCGHEPSNAACSSLLMWRWGGTLSAADEMCPSYTALRHVVQENLIPCKLCYLRDPQTRSSRALHHSSTEPEGVLLASPATLW